MASETVEEVQTDSITWTSIGERMHRIFCGSREEFELVYVHGI